MIKAIFTNTFGILVSRILGFVRDLLTASILGANIYSDVFFVSFKLPNLFRRIFAEGSFTQTFLPAFINSKYKSVFAGKIFMRFLLIIIFMSLIVTIFSESVTKLFAYGFSDEVISMASDFVVINFYYLDLIFVATFFGSLLQYKNHFSVSAFSTALLNIAMIVALIISQNMQKIDIVFYLSWGVVVGGFLQVVVHWMALRHHRLDKILTMGIPAIAIKYHKIEESVKRFNKNFLPSILGNSTAQISSFIDTYLATFLVSGTISYLYYANRVFQLPLAMFAIATSTALFPTIAKAIKNQDEFKAMHYMEKSFWFLTFLLAISTLGGVLLSREITALLFEHGEFTHTDTLNTASVLIMYMIGLLPFGLAKIFSLWLYSKEMQIKAAKISTISLIINIIFSIILINPMGGVGLALSSSIGGAVLFILTLKEFGFKRFWKIFSIEKFAILVLTLNVEAILIYLFLEFIK